jgi:NTP pyrophosphatase (non-canonical NTP hydrolase)
MTEEREYYPSWICGDCGDLHGYRECGVATWHNDTCGVCGEYKACTEPRDFGHLKNSWKVHHSSITPKIVLESDLSEKEELLDLTEYTPTNILDGVKQNTLKPKNIIQIMNDDLAKRNGFSVDPSSVFRMVPEVGELVDAVLKYEGMKKIKSTDSKDNLIEEIRDGIGDVLVLLAQVASAYGIDMEQAYMDTYYLVSRRDYHEQ